MSASPQPPAPAGHLSPDGFWWWDGTRWLPVAQPQYQPPQPRPRSPRPNTAWLRVSAGVTGLAGTAATLVACIVPYGSFPDPTGGPTTSSSIFSGGFVGAGWDVPEPVFVIAAAAVASILVLGLVGKVAQAVAAGLLLAVGLQTATMWLAYVGLAGSEGSVGAGGIIGLVGALLLLLAGVLALTHVLLPPPAGSASDTSAAVTPANAETGGAGST